MSRQDIADYLGLTIETVSRSLTQLEHAAAIALPSFTPHRSVQSQDIKPPEFINPDRIAFADMEDCHESQRHHDAGRDFSRPRCDGASGGALHASAPYQRPAGHRQDGNSRRYSV